MRMKHSVPSSRRATNVSLDTAVISEAKALGINVSQACERGLVETVNEARAALWREENREALEEYNRHLAEQGLPLAQNRLF